MDLKLIKQLQEADLFQGPSPEEVNLRRTSRFEQRMKLLKQFHTGDKVLADGVEATVIGVRRDTDGLVAVHYTKDHKGKTLDVYRVEELKKLNEDFGKTLAAGAIAASTLFGPMSTPPVDAAGKVGQHVTAPTKLNQANLVKVDKRLYDVVWAEAGGPDEVIPTASVYLNRVMMDGYEKALRGSSANNKGSVQYNKAKAGQISAALEKELLTLQSRVKEAKHKKLKPNPNDIARIKAINLMGMSSYEMKQYNVMKTTIDSLLADPTKILHYDYHENINNYGEPSWVKDMVSGKVIGTQKFFMSKRLQKALNGH